MLERLHKVFHELPWSRAAQCPSNDVTPEDALLPCKPVCDRGRQKRAEQLVQVLTHSASLRTSIRLTEFLPASVTLYSFRACWVVPLFLSCTTR